jgi:HemY protein
LFQTIWFFIKISLFSGAAIWLVTQQGEVSMSLVGYTVTMQIGIFFLVLAIFIFTLFFVLRFVRALFSMPTTIAKYNAAGKRKKSFRALTRGLVAVAAGDAKRATQYSKQTKALWPDLNGLPLLLEAQAAKLRGEDGLAQNRFEHLLKDKDAAFLGVRGLLKTALDNNDFERALGFARQAEKQHPKKPWVIRCVYDLEIKNRLWLEALHTNQKAQKLEVDDKDKLISDRVAIFLHEHDKMLRAGENKRAFSEVKKAYKLDPIFVPTITRYCDHLLQMGKKRKCASVVEKAWRISPHPDLADIWVRLAPLPKGKNATKDNTKTMDWYEKLVAFKPDSAESQMACARAAMDIEYWGEAKAYLMVAEKIYPSARLYRMQAIVEQNSTHNDESIHRLMKRAAEALPNKVWICRETGMVYEEWKAIAKPHGSFNSMVWDYAGARVMQSNSNILSASNDTALLIDPAA